ncbi:MAG: putative DNA-binding domain-containing protein [Hyphomicrobiaceae bacterium]
MSTSRSTARDATVEETPRPQRAPGLAELQQAFQSAVVKGSPDVLVHLTGNSRVGPDVLLGVYRHAYASRLVAAMRNDHTALLAYLGEAAFEDLARHYIATLPSRSPNIRDISRELAKFIARTAPYDSYREVAEIALIECAVNDAFDAADVPSFRIDDLAALPAGAWGILPLAATPSASVLNLGSNAHAIWRAINDGATPPLPDRNRLDHAVLVWRENFTPKVRPLGPEEAILVAMLARGTTFGELCETAALYDAPDEAAARCAAYLGTWLGCELLVRPTGAMPAV